MTQFFSPDYCAARDRFRAAVLSQNGQLESITLTAKGPNDQDLSIDIGWFGSPEPRRVFVHTSGVHGVEGFAGSAIQLQWLEDGLPYLPTDGAIAIVHCLNPYGMATLRRVNTDNVDINRNFLAVDEDYAGAPEHHAGLDSLLNPKSAIFDFFGLRAAWKMWRHGVPAMRNAVSAGQYENARGLFYGGPKRTQEARRFQLYLTSRLAHADRIVVLDVHTGPGTFAGQTLSSGADGARGTLFGLYDRMFPGARLHFTAQRFGVGPPMQVLKALRSENRAHFHGGAGASLYEIYCPADGKWREAVLARGSEVIAQGVQLAFSSLAADRMAAD